jgi:hypothetical protein
VTWRWRACLTFALVACGGAETKTTNAPTAATPLAAPERHLRFRRTSTGMVQGTSTRQTCALDLDARGSILRCVREEGASSTVAKIDSLAWRGVDDVSYSSTERLDASSGAVSLERVGGAAELVLRCNEAKVRALSADATFVHGDACGNGDGPKPRWDPAATTSVAVLHCESGAKEDDGEHEGSYDFADGAGLEWIFENSDCSGQEGALRAMK